MENDNEDDDDNEDETMTMTQPDLVSKLREALTGINPFSGGRDGDECLWCRRDYPKFCKTMEEYFLPEHHQSDCQLILALTIETQPVESLLGREGQAASSVNPAWKDEALQSRINEAVDAAQEPCGPSQSETEGEAGRQPVCANSPSVQPSPSTPIVPGTAGLSAKQVREAHIATMHESLDFQDSYFYRKLADRLNALLGAAKPGIDWVAQNKLAQADEKRDCEKALLALAGWYPTPVEGYGFNTSWAISDLCKAIAGLREREAQIRKDVLEEAAQVVEKAFEQSWVVQDTLDAIRALAERPARQVK